MCNLQVIAFVQIVSTLEKKKYNLPAIILCTCAGVKGSLTFTNVSWGTALGIAPLFKTKLFVHFEMRT